MKCYNHHDRDAFGICKSCGKGLCLDCLKETEMGLVCKDSSHCEELLSIVNYSYNVMKKQAFSKKRKWLIFFAGFAFSNTTIDATACIPDIFEISNASI